MKIMTDSLKDAATRGYAQGWEAGWNAAHVSLKTTLALPHKEVDEPEQAISALGAAARKYDWREAPLLASGTNPVDAAFGVNRHPANEE